MELQFDIDFYDQMWTSNASSATRLSFQNKGMSAENYADLRWLDWIFWGWYLPSLSINYVGMSKDMEKRLPQLYYIKMKISYDLGFIVIRVAMAT